MPTFKILNLSITNTILRFYAVMAVVIICGFMSQWMLAALLSYGLVFSAILGISFEWKKEDKKVLDKKSGKIIRIHNQRGMRQAS